MIILSAWRPRDASEESFDVTILPEEVNIVRQPEIETLHKFRHRLQNCDEEDLLGLFRNRNEIDRSVPYRARTMIWKELVQRYPNMPNRPIILRLPYFDELRALWREARFCTPQALGRRKMLTLTMLALVTLAQPVFGTPAGAQKKT